MPRKNPTGPAVSLVAIAFRRQPELLRELRAAGGKPSLDFASRLLSEWTGKPYSQVRSGALATLSTYVRQKFSSARVATPAGDALAWLAWKDRRLCVAVMLQLLDQAYSELRARERRDADKAVAMARRWFAGGRVDAAERAELESVLDLAADTYPVGPGGGVSDQPRPRQYLLSTSALVAMLDKNDDHWASAQVFAANVAAATDAPKQEALNRIADAISNAPEDY